MPNPASVVAILLISSLSCPVVAAQSAANTASPPASAEREQILGRIRALVGKIEKVSDDRARLAGLSLFGDVVCKEDPELARDSFRKAVAIAQQLEEEPKPLAQPAKAGLPPQPDRTWATLLQRVARCDADLALELRKQTEEKLDPLAGSQPSATIAPARWPRMLAKLPCAMKCSAWWISRKPCAPSNAASFLTPPKPQPSGQTASNARCCSPRWRLPTLGKRKTIERLPAFWKRFARRAW